MTRHPELVEGSGVMGAHCTRFFDSAALRSEGQKGEGGLAASAANITDVRQLQRKRALPPGRRQLR
jgi:hypothetical protein